MAALSLLAPFAIAYLFVVPAWLSQYQGVCGGWLGEATRSSLDRHAWQTLLWAAMGMPMPGLAGIVLGLAVLTVKSVVESPERKRGAKYIVGTLKAMLRQFERHLPDQNWFLARAIVKSCVERSWIRRRSAGLRR